MAEEKITGKVVHVNVKGQGYNSAQLEFTVENQSSQTKRTIVGNAFPAYEPQIFSSVAALSCLLICQT